MLALSSRILTLALAIVFTFSVSAQEKAEQEKVELQNRSRFEQLELFNKVLFLIENQYYRKVDTEKLVEGAIKGMMETLDPHSSFMNKDFFQKMQSDTSGEFGGLGLEVTQKEGVIVVITPIEDTPAYRAGIRPKDRLVEINHESIVGMTLDQAVEKMRGKIGSFMHLGIAREGQEGLLHFNLKREIIKVNPVKSELLAGNVAYVRLTQFQRRAAESVETALKKMQEDTKKSGGLAGIVLDLRYNPGGLLDQAVDLSSLFLKEGIVVTTESRDPQNKDIRYVKKTGWKDLTTPVAVLINGASASASEIVAGALQDFGRAVIMGTQSFGKGSVQTVAPLDHGTGIKLTIAQYLTPKNRRIQGVGIKPDIAIDDVNVKDWDKIKRQDRFIREKDLRNHLTAYEETAEEKRLREETEKEERIQRTKEIEAKKKQAKNKVVESSEEEDDIELRNADPKKDFQVQQAAQYLKGISWWESEKR